MRTSTLLTALAVALTLTATPVLGQDRAAIENAQKTLKQQGHDPGSVDGVIGPQTIAAVRAYQKEQGLEVTGRLDASTLVKLGDSAKAGDQASKPSADQAAKANAQGTKPAKDEPSSGPSGSPNTSGDKKSSAVDPSQATKTGANAGEGASYSRSNDKGDSALPKQQPEKK